MHDGDRMRLCKFRDLRVGEPREIGLAAVRIHDVVDRLPARRLQRVEAGLVKRRGLDDSALVLFHDRHLGGRAVRRGEQCLFSGGGDGEK